MDGMNIGNEQRIAAVIVTYNRKNLLEQCLISLLNQTRRLDHIIIIDNASNDGTEAFLSSRSYLAKENVEYVKLQQNIGGAGGFNEGMKRGYEAGYDWLWLMDDDGLPEYNCLEILLDDSCKNDLFRAPLVVNIENEDELAFGYSLPNDKRQLKTISEVRNIMTNGKVYGLANPFNGVLVHRDIIQNIGFPIKDLFLWGDEVEYLLRIQRAGYLIVTKVNAIHKHPKDRMTLHKCKLLGIKFSVAHTENSFKDYLILRNYAYLAKKYYGWKGLLKHIVKYSVFYTRKYGNRHVAHVLKYSFEGATGRLSGHINFLS